MSAIHNLTLRIAGKHSVTWRGGPPSAPTMQRRNEQGSDHVVANNNHGYELWFGTPTTWHHHIDSREARALFWWLLFRWFAQARWFGIRRPLYYWALHHRVAGYMKAHQS